MSPPPTLFRVGRWPNPFKWPPPPDPLSLSGSFDRSRWDDPEGEFSTIYAATDALGAFIEVLPYYRRSPEDFLARLYSETSEDEPDEDVDYADGEIKPDFFSRLLGRAKLHDGVRFVDVDHPQTHAELNREMPELLHEFGFQEFDRGVVMHQDRRVTRPIAGFLHDRFEGSDVVGIRYESRRYAARECWAIWERSGLIYDVDPDPLVPAMPDLQAAAAVLGLRLPRNV
jgi:hypothetical protein